MRKLSTAGRLLSMVMAVALFWCHGGYLQAHEGNLGGPTTFGGTVAIHAPASAPAMMLATGCAFAVKSLGSPGGTTLSTPAPSPDGARMAAVSPPVLLFDPPQAVRLAAGTAPYHASLFQQAVLIRI